MAEAEALREQVERKLASGAELATLWGVVQRVQEITSNPESSSRELAKVIGSDPVLTAKVLQTVNSAAFGFPERITNLDEAVVVLGYDPLKGLCTGLIAIASLGTRSKCAGFTREALWRHSLGTAVVSKRIQERLAGAKGEDLFVAGLLSNIGRVILDQHFSAEFAEIQRMADQDGLRMLEAERQVLGVSHAHIGAWAAGLWHLSPTLTQTIRDHHGPADTPAACIVNLAYVIVHAQRFGTPGDQTLTSLVPQVIDRLQIDKQTLCEIVQQAQEELDLIEPVVDVIFGN
ncbi:MAG: HDOD domain-containing protein [Kiritimatiellae bacterium]|nr:HDOD domain-containing protein [Kiritimatiellia bacterium]